jgi:hypothetical protein
MVEAHGADDLHLTHDHPGTVNHLESRGRDARDAPPLAHEKPDAELRFQQLQLLADPGLAREHTVRRGRHIEPAVGDREHIHQLPEFHRHRLSRCGHVDDERPMKFS